MRSVALQPIDVPDADDVEILWVGDARACDASLAGGKAANLSRLAAAHPVPYGFVVATGAARLDRRARAIVATAYDRLAERTGIAAPAVAVRSSAIDEDGPGASFAGQHESFLNVAGADQVWWATCRCLASFRSERATGYRRASGLAALPERAAVLVQCQVPADASAVVFSANPITGSRDEVVVNASWGLGESIVGGTVTPDAYLVARDGLAVRRHVAVKERMTVPVNGGTREVTVPSRIARMPALEDDDARAAAELALALENQMGWPVDLELAWAGTDLFLLQCRPITTLPDDRSPAA
jgi:pyruvate,water dikinase